MATLSGTDDAKRRRARYAEMLMTQGASAEPVQHWTQGLARLAQGVTGGLISGELDRDEKAERQKRSAALAAMLGDEPNGLAAAETAPAAMPTAPNPPPVKTAELPPPQNGTPFGILSNESYKELYPDAKPNNTVDRLASTIIKHESGGKYDIVGPVVTYPSGKTDRPYGAYQIMGANIPAWTKEVLGKEMTPDEFLRNREAQDIVGRAKIEQAYKKYGNAEDVFAVWASGRPLAMSANNKDLVFGTTVKDIVAKRMADMNRNVQPAGAPASPAGPPPAAPAQGRLSDALKTRIRMMLESGDPQLEAMGTQLLFKSLTEEDKSTDEIREYNLAVRQGETRNFTDWKAALKREGAPKTITNVDTRGETKFAEAVGKNQAERFDKIVQAGADAKGMIANLQALRDIGSRITTGKTAQYKAALGPYAEMVGVKIDGLDDLQAYEAIVARLAPQMRVAGSGATSDFEMQQFLKALPSLGRAPGGNELISRTLDALSEHKVAAAEIASRAMSGEITPKEAEKLLRALPDPLTLWKQSRGKTGPIGNDRPAPKKAKTKSGIEYEVE